MDEVSPSRTALYTAYFRGYHSTHDTPRIFEDHLAFRLLTDEEKSDIEESFRRAQEAIDPVRAASYTNREAALRSIMQRVSSLPIVLGRARYAEDLLAVAVAEGVRQYVILGAGMDSFSFRRPDILEGLRVFEVDHPRMQAFKRRRLAELDWHIPANLHFVPLDFTVDRLSDGLAETSYRSDLPTFFSWLGVSYYLRRESVLSTFSTIAKIAPTGSLMVFDYLDTDAFLPEKTSPRVHYMLKAVKEAGEPMFTGMDPSTLAANLAPLGLHLREDLGPVDIEHRYFLGRTDEYRACEYAHYACAVVT